MGRLRVITLILCLVVLTESQRGKQGTKCTTPNRKDGLCINIKKCQSILDLLRKHRDEPGVLDFVRRSGCGYDPSTPNVPLVCCAVSSSNLLSPPTCGRSTILDHDKIVGGAPAQLGAWPWIAVLGYKTKRNPGPSWRCGGTLISARYVITAAHCTYPPGFTLFLVRLGELNLDSKVNDGATPKDFRIERILNHEGYNPQKFINDIALLKLQQSVTFTDLIRPICLPQTKALKEKDFTGYSPFLAGWGATSYKGSSSQKLLEVQVEILEDEVCRNAYKGKANITNKQLCAGEDGKDACQGDSGGPMMWPSGINSDFYLIGVVSFGINCADERYPGIYTRVTEYIDWISKNTKS